MSENLDLLGDPIPENHGSRGRPPHCPTLENRNKVRLLLAMKWKDRQIAQALRITATTLRKHYFRELRQRDEALPALKASRLMALWKAMLGGNVGAAKELGKEIDQLELQALAADVREPDKPPRKLGKKEQLLEDAGQVQGKFAPPAPPMRIQ